MKIYFIQSTPYYGDNKLIKKGRLYFVGLAPAILASLVPDCDFEVCLETIEDVNFESDCDIVAISGMGHAIIRSIDIAKEFKKGARRLLWADIWSALCPRKQKVLRQCYNRRCGTELPSNGQGLQNGLLEGILQYASGEINLPPSQI